MTPPTKTDPTTHYYNHLAPTYDARYTDPYHQQENRTVASWLTPNVTTLDIGCGTGLLPEILDLTVDDYLGLDPSAGMLAEFERKAYGYPTVQATFADWISDEPGMFGPAAGWDQVVALFGSASYLTAEDLYAMPSLLTAAGRTLLMFYTDGYLPDFERDDPAVQDVAWLARQTGLQLARENNGDSWEWHDFTVVTVWA